MITDYDPQQNTAVAFKAMKKNDLEGFKKSLPDGLSNADWNTLIDYAVETNRVEFFKIMWAHRNRIESKIMILFNRASTYGALDILEEMWPKVLKHGYVDANTRLTPTMRNAAINGQMKVLDWVKEKAKSNPDIAAFSEMTGITDRVFANGQMPILFRYFREGGQDLKFETNTLINAPAQRVKKMFTILYRLQRFDLADQFWALLPEKHKTDDIKEYHLKTKRAYFLASRQSLPSARNF